MPFCSKHWFYKVFGVRKGSFRSPWPRKVSERFHPEMARKPTPQISPQIFANPRKSTARICKILRRNLEILARLLAEIRLGFAGPDLY